jgi:Terminase RNaseH-like domain
MRHENTEHPPRLENVSQAVRALSGFTVTPSPESGDKLTRFGPFSSQCRAGNVKILRGPWNEALFHILEGFPDLAHNDEVDACSGALEMLNPQMKRPPRRAYGRVASVTEQAHFEPSAAPATILFPSHPGARLSARL